MLTIVGEYNVKKRKKKLYFNKRIKKPTNIVMEVVQKGSRIVIIVKKNSSKYFVLQRLIESNKSH